MSLRATRAPREGLDGGAAPSAVAAAVTWVGVVVAFAGVEHGLGELLQPASRPSGLVIESWPHVDAFEPLGGEPALTVLPDLQVAGTLTIAVSLVFGWWASRSGARRRDGWGLLGLSVLMLLVGGGMAPPLLGAILAAAVLRAAGEPTPSRRPGQALAALARWWRVLVGLTVTALLVLVPGTVLLRWADVDVTWLAYVLPPVALGGLALALVGALAHDRAAAAPAAPVRRPDRR